MLALSGRLVALFVNQSEHPTQDLIGQLSPRPSAPSIASVRWGWNDTHTSRGCPRFPAGLFCTDCSVPIGFTFVRSIAPMILGADVRLETVSRCKSVGGIVRVPKHGNLVNYPGRISFRSYPGSPPTVSLPLSDFGGPARPHFAPILSWRTGRLLSVL